MYRNPRGPPRSHEKSMSALNVFFKCPYTIHSGVYTYVFMYGEFKKSKSKALTQANVQKSKMAATLTWKIYV